MISSRMRTRETVTSSSVVSSDLKVSIASVVKPAGPLT